jgi:peptide/nickel transport system ATP-binding protein
MPETGTCSRAGTQLGPVTRTTPTCRSPDTKERQVAGSGTAPLRHPDQVLLRVEHLVVEHPVGRGRRIHAVSDVSFDIARGETLGLVGETGCGKSTTGRGVLQLPPPTAGSVRFGGKELVGLKKAEMRSVRPSMQIILQDPLSSLNPRRRVSDIVAAPLRAWGRPQAQIDEKVAWALDAVGLDPARVGGRRPRSFSGGQAQRICIARALVLEPQLLVCDEPVSALDVSVQAQVLNLLQDMKEELGLTMLFISHDLAVVSHVSDRVAVMYLGKLCEIGDAESIYEQPAHPYTAALLASVPEPDPDVEPTAPEMSSVLPSPINPPEGCRFSTRCPRATALCTEREPVMSLVAGDHYVACHHPLVPVTLVGSASLSASAEG